MSLSTPYSIQTAPSLFNHNSIYSDLIGTPLPESPPSSPSEMLSTRFPLPPLHLSSWNSPNDIASIAKLFNTSKPPVLKRWNAVVEGWRTRQQAVLPRQLLPMFKAHLSTEYNETQLNNMAINFAIAINHIVDNLSTYRNKSIRIGQLGLGDNGTQLLYTFPDLSPRGKNKKEEIKFPVCRLEIPNSAKIINLFIPARHQTGISASSYLAVYPTRHFTIPLALRKIIPLTPNKPKHTRDISYAAVVLKTPITHHLTPQELKTGLLSIQEGMRVHKLLLTISMVKLPALPRLLLHSTGLGSPLEWTQTWYNSDLSVLTSPNGNTTIPLDIGLNAPKQKINWNDALSAIIDVAITLEQLHAKNIVHHDTKPSNILLHRDSQTSKIKGLLSDFDCTNELGVDEPSTTSYIYWSPLIREGYITPLGDIYALGITLGEIILPNFQTTGKDIASYTHKEFCILLIESLSSHAAQRVPINKALYKQLRNSKSSAEVIHQITPFLDRHYSPQTKHRIDRLKAELEVIKQTCNLLWRIIQMEQLAHTHVHNDLEISQLLKAQQLSERQKGISKLLLLLAKDPSFITTGSMASFLTTIKNNYNSVLIQRKI